MSPCVFSVTFEARIWFLRELSPTKFQVAYHQVIQICEDNDIFRKFFLSFEKNKAWIKLKICNMKEKD